jgi:RND family efflux transporter MFP subunit
MKILFSGCLLAASALLTAGCHSPQPASQAAVEMVQARVVESRQQQVPLNIRSTGTVQARESATVSAQVAGRIRQVLVRAGDSVRAGQTLVILDDADLRASAAQAQATVTAAQSEQAAAESDAQLAASTLVRYRQLESEKSVSPQEMDEVSRRAQAANARFNGARAQTKAAQAQQSGARTTLGHARLVAPFDGVVTARMADPGTLATPGAPLLQVDRVGNLQLDTTVDESVIGAIHRGMKVQVAIDGAETANLSGTVAEIDPAANPSSRSFLVKIDLPPASQLRAGEYGSAEFPNGFHQAMLVPRSAVVERGSLACAYVLDGQGIAQLRYLTLGAVQGNLVEVLSGIAGGEKLVDEPLDRDLAGKRIAEMHTGSQP